MAAVPADPGLGFLPTARQARQKAGNPLLRAGQEAKLSQACRLYESHFLSTLWKEMRKTSAGKGLVHGGYGEDIFTGLLDQARSDALASRGALGIAEMLQGQLSRSPAPTAAAAPGQAASSLNPLHWPKPPASSPAPEQAGPFAPPDARDEGDPLAGPPADVPQEITSVTLPMPEDESVEESALTTWPAAPAAQAPLASSLSRGPEMLPPVMGAVTSTFGLRLHPVSGDIRPHQGLDLAAPLGTPVKAALAGVVRFAGNAGDYGRLVVIEHDDGSSTFYGHCRSLSVTPGQRVAQGQMVARVGMTGQATGPHLHFEVRDALGRAVDPLPMVAGRLQTSS